MLSALIYILLAVAVLIGVMLLIASRRPDTFRVARSREIAAAPEEIFGLINDLRKMNTWNPYALRKTGGNARYSGPDSGKGATYYFAGGKSGSGHIEIVECQPHSRVTLRLVMVKPFKCDNTVEFMLAPKPGGTDVTWAMHGRQPLLGKLMTLFIDSDKMVGRDFEEGLANLKTMAEKR